MGSIARVSATRRLWNSYNKSLEARPIFTKCATSLTGFCIGDTIAQFATSGHTYDWKRTARFMGYGVAVHAPSCHFFYKFLDRAILPHAAASTRAVITKVAIDQLLYTPVAIGAFYFTLDTLEGHPLRLQETMTEKFKPTLLAGWTVWPLVHVINFRFIPSSQRVLYINCVQILWNTVLCKIASRTPPNTVSLEAKHQLEEGLPVPG